MNKLMPHLALGLALSGPLLAATSTTTTSENAASGAAKRPDLCVFLGNHWSYTGVGWSYGLESCIQSIADSLDMADYSPSVRTGINLDAAAYPLVATARPDLIERLKRYLADGRVEIIGGTYGQALGSMISGESNVRQLVTGQQTVRQTLGITVASFLEEEEFTHPQIPQLLRGAGYRLTSTAQCDTWGKHGSPKLNLSLVDWQGLDGTRIPAFPANALVFHPPVVTHDIDWLWTPEGQTAREDLARSGMPLAIKWVEFGWGPGELEGKTANKFFASKFRELSEKFDVRYVSLQEYLAHYGDGPREPFQWRMDDFRKLLPWGCGGDQLRRKQREVEATLLAAERFDAVASLLGVGSGRESELDGAWKHLLVSQSHDVSLCEYLDDGLDKVGIQDRIAQQFVADTGTPQENAKVTTWGDLGFRRLAVAEKRGQAVLASALEAIGSIADTTPSQRGREAVIVFNGTSTPRDAVVSMPSPRPAGTDVRVYDAAGRPVLSQTLAPRGTGTDSGTLLFDARELPAVGYSTFYLGEADGAPAARTDLRISETGWKFENDCVAVELDPVNGAISRLIDRRTGLSLIDSQQGTFPLFHGRPNRKFLSAEEAPGGYDSASSRATLSWEERGPVRAVVKVSHSLPRLRLDYWISLQAGSPQVDVRIRVAADAPPEKTSERVNGWQPPLHISDGYWFSFATAFKPTSIIRDFPFGVEACVKDAIDALNFVDFTGPAGGLLLVHDGTQYFKRTGETEFSNLAIRDWHGLFMKKSGWPTEAEYRFALVPHGPDFTNADRLRNVENFDQAPFAVVSAPHPGRLGRRHQFLTVNSTDIALSSFRKTGQGVYEARVFAPNGRASSGQLRLDLPVGRYAVSDLLGNPQVPFQPSSRGEIPLALSPWQVSTLQIESP